MASSFSRKSSSSASKAPKPTYRRASAAGGKRGLSSGGSAPSPVRSKRGSSPSIPAPAPRKPAGSYTVPTKRGSKPVLPKVGAAPKTKSKRAVAVKPPRTVSVPAKPSTKGAAPARAGRVKLPFKMPSIGRAKPIAPRKLSGAGAGVAGAAGPIPPVAPVKQKPASARGRNPLARILAPVGALLSRLPLPRASRKIALAAAGGLVALAVVAIVVINSPIFAATEVVVNGSEHVTQQAAQQLVSVPEGTTLFNVNEAQIAEALKANPWVMGVDIQRTFPHKLVITPHERSVTAIAYITADEIAWAIGEDGTWVAPLSLSLAVDANGAEVQPAADGTLPEGARQLSGLEAALTIAKRDGALLLTDVPSDVEPAAGEAVDSKVVEAGLEYAKGFSKDFLGQIKELSVASVEAISANLTSGVEVSLGEPEDIVEKERVVTKLLSQEQGVTYINVREPGAYTFRSAPAE